MPAKPIRNRLIPFRILSYLLYSKAEWISVGKDGQLDIVTGEAARELRLTSTKFWESLYWLEDAQLVEKVSKGRKRGVAHISLRKPTNII